MIELKMKYVLVFVIIVFLLYLSSSMCSNEGFNVGVKYSLNKLPNFSDCKVKAVVDEIFTCDDLLTRQMTIDALCTNLKDVCDTIDPTRKKLCADPDFFTDCKRYIEE